MSRIAYVNGRYVPHAQAAVHVEDRGYQFADGVYEVCAVVDGLLIDEAAHLDRLDRSLAELRIDHPMPRTALRAVMREIVRRNRIRDGLIYMQVTRGVARRDHAFPANVRPALVVTAKAISPGKLDANAAKGVAVATMPDIRWGRCDIKSVGLLPNVLAKQAAREAGAFEAWLVDRDGYVTEGSSTNAWIVDQDGNLVTRDVSNEILRGITRQSLIEAAKEAGVRIVERRFTVEEAKRAREAFITSATAYVTPVVRIDDAVIGNGEPGSIALRLRRLYLDFARAGATPETPRAAAE
jgi:D-alanine transaminase